MKFSLLNPVPRKLFKSLALVVAFVFVIGHFTCSISFYIQTLNAWGRTWFDIMVAYTNHIVIPEALEKWPLDLLQKLCRTMLRLLKLLMKRYYSLCHVLNCGYDIWKIVGDICNLQFLYAIQSCHPYQRFDLMFIVLC